jgi:tape measure domain-containing protein
MDEVIGSAWVEINSNIKELQRDITGIRKHVDDSAKHIETRFNSATKAITLMGSAIAGIGVAKLGADIYGASIKMDTMNRMLTNIEGSQEKANKRFEQFRILAKEPVLDPFNLSRFYVGLKSVNVEADLSIRFMKSLANSMAGVGAGNEEFARSMEQFVQMMGKGKLVGQDLRVIAESFPQIRKMIGEAFDGITDPEELAKKGYTALEVLTKLNEVMEKQPHFAGGAQAALDNFKQSLQLFEGALGKDVLPTISKFLDKLTNLMDAFSAMPEATKKVIGTSVVGGLGLLGIGAALSSIISLIGLTKEGLVALGAIKIGANVAGLASGVAGAGLATNAGMGTGALAGVVVKESALATGAGIGAQAGMVTATGALGTAAAITLMTGAAITVIGSGLILAEMAGNEKVQDFLYGGKPTKGGLLDKDAQIAASTQEELVKRLATLKEGTAEYSDIVNKLKASMGGIFAKPITAKESYDLTPEQTKQLSAFNEPTGIAGMGIESMYGGLEKRVTPLPEQIQKIGIEVSGLSELGMFSDMMNDIDKSQAIVNTANQLKAFDEATKKADDTALSLITTSIKLETTQETQKNILTQNVQGFDQYGISAEDAGKAQTWLIENTQKLNAELDKTAISMMLSSKRLEEGELRKQEALRSTGRAFDDYGVSAEDAKKASEWWAKNAEGLKKETSQFWKDMGSLSKWTMDSVITKSVDDMFNYFTEKQVTAGSLYNNWIGDMGISWEDWSRDFKKLEDDRYKYAIDAWNDYGYKMGLNYDDFETAWDTTHTSMWDTWKTFLTDMLKEWGTTLATKLAMYGTEKTAEWALDKAKGWTVGGSTAPEYGGSEESTSGGSGSSSDGTLPKVDLTKVPKRLSGWLKLAEDIKTNKGEGGSGAWGGPVGSGETSTISSRGEGTTTSGGNVSLWKEQWVSDHGWDHWYMPYGKVDKYLSKDSAEDKAWKKLYPEGMRIDSGGGKGVYLATGGIVTRPTMAMLGDNPSHREAVIPLDSPQGKQMLSGASGGVTIENINLAISLPNATLDSVDQNQVDRFFNQKLLPSLKRAVAGGALS